jgi:hypothetical protein
VKLFELVVLAIVPLVIAVGQLLFKLVSVLAPEVNGMEGVLFYDFRLWIAIALYGGGNHCLDSGYQGNIPIGRRSMKTEESKGRKRTGLEFLRCRGRADSPAGDEIGTRGHDRY